MALSQRVWSCRGRASRTLAPCRSSPACCIARHSPNWPAFLGHNTLLCIATQNLSQANFRLSRYTDCIVTQPSPQPTCAPILLCHDTIGDCMVTQVSSPTALFCHNTLTCIATQSSHQPLPSLPACNTNQCIAILAIPALLKPPYCNTI